MGDVVDSKSMDKLMSVTGFLAQLAISLPIGLAALLLFALLRPKNGMVYQRRVKYVDNDKKPPKLDDGWFSWIRPVLTYPPNDLVSKVGLDAVIFIRFLSFCAKFFLLAGVLAMAVLIPFNLMAYYKQPDYEPSFTFQMISIVAARDTPQYLWPHVGMTWFLSLLLYIALFRLWKDFVVLRQAYFHSDDYRNALHSRTMLLTNVPHGMQQDEALSKFVEKHRLLSAQCQASVSRQLNDLPKLIEEHEQVLFKLERVLHDHLRKPQKVSGKRPTVSEGGVCGTRVDAIELYTNQLMQLEVEIQAERKKCSQFKPSSVGFITYPTVDAAHYAAKTLRSELSSSRGKGSTPDMMLAPPARDIVWTNVGLSSKVRSTRSLSGTLIYLGLLFGGLSVISALSTLANLDSLRKYRSVNLFARQHKTLFALLASLVTPLIMMVFFMLLPTLLRLISRYQGIFTKSGIERDVLRKYFTFLLVNNFMFLVSGLLIELWSSFQKGDFDQVGQTLSHSDDILNELAAKLINISTFWGNYITLKGIGVLVELAQLVMLAKIWLMQRSIRNPTPREERESKRPPDFPYAVLYAVHLFLFAVGLMFCVISPIIMLFACVNFGLSLLVYKYLLMYVYITKVETGGQMWPVVFNRMLFSLFVFQVLMVGAVNFDLSSWQCAALIPLPLLTILYKFVHSRFYRSDFKYTVEAGKSNFCMDGDAGGKQLALTRTDIQERYAHRAMTTSLPIVLVNRDVALNIAKYYKGAYRVEGDYTKDQDVEHAPHRNSWLASKMPAIPQPNVVVVDSDVDTDEECEMAEQRTLAPHPYIPGQQNWSRGSTPTGSRRTTPYQQQQPQYPQTAHARPSPGHSPGMVPARPSPGHSPGMYPQRQPPPMASAPQQSQYPPQQPLYMPAQQSRALPQPPYPTTSNLRPSQPNSWESDGSFIALAPADTTDHLFTPDVFLPRPPPPPPTNLSKSHDKFDDSLVTDSYQGYEEYLSTVAEPFPSLDKK